MTHNDTVKQILQNNRPEPTAAFSQGVRSALMGLPGRKKKASIVKALPKFAAAALAVAAVCVLAVYVGAPVQKPSSTILAPEPSASLPKFTYAVETYDSENGFSEGVSYAGTDGNILQIKLEFSYLPKNGIVYVENSNILIDGETYTITSSNGGSPGDPGTYANSATEEPILLKKKVEGSTAHVAVSTSIVSYEDSTAKEKEQGIYYTGQGTAVATLNYSFDLPVCKSAEIQSTGIGSKIYGFDAQFKHFYRSSGTTTLVFSLADNAQGDLAAFYKKHASPGDSAVDFEQIGQPLFLFNSIISNAVQSLPKNSEISLQHLWGAEPFGNYNIIIEPSENGRMDMYIILYSSLAPDHGFTIISSASYATAKKSIASTPLDYYYVSCP